MPRLTATERPGSMRHRKLADPGRDVRLLEILPARTPEEPIVCRIVTTSLDKLDSDILALSSLLGDPQVTETIYVDGKAVSLTSHQAAGLRSIRAKFSSSSKRQTRNSTLSNSAKPHGSKLALPQRLLNFLRVPDPGLYVWLDSICVNSNDKDETERLKETMKKVYNASKIVTGWLGPAIDTTDKGLTVFNTIDEVMPRFWGDPGDRELHPDDYAPKHRCFNAMSHLWKDGDDGTVAFLLPHWVGANDFMHRSYFQRQWILQELFMANNPAFMIGERIVTWRSILRLNRILEEFKDNESDIFPGQFRPAIAELPLGTVYELLEELMRRKQHLGSIHNIEEDGNDIFPYHAFDPEMMSDRKVIDKDSASV
ncbi:unnamed protein product [Discula destructiva]